jgi:hypothetical protein
MVNISGLNLWSNELSDPLNNYKTDTLYVGPDNGQGKYITFVMDVSPQVKLAIKAFYVNNKEDITSFELVKIKSGKKEECVTFSKMDLTKILQFCEALKELDLKETSSTRLKFSSDMKVDFETIKALVENRTNLDDVYALERKRQALQVFTDLMNDKQTGENAWQKFFEENPWIFGHGLNYIFLDNVGSKLEQTTKGSDFNSGGKRVDALMKTKAEVSQYVLVEIKKNETDLINSKPYRSGCWQVSDELSGAVAQIQKTTYGFTKNRFDDRIKDKQGKFTGETIYSIQPKSYLIIGNLQQLAENEDQLVCFELYRKSINTPEIITFDELYERAKCIVNNLSGENDKVSNSSVTPDDEDIPF